MKKNNIILKLSSAILILGVILSSYFLFSAYKYNIYINNFFNYFNEKDFKTANQYLIEKENFNLYKFLSLNKDLENFSSKTVNTLSSKLQANNTTELEVAEILSELEKLSTNTSIGNLKNKLSLMNASKESFNKGKSLLDDNTITSIASAINFFEEVSPYSDEYSNSLELKSEATLDLKKLVLQSGESYVDNKDITKAIGLIEKYEDYLIGDNDISEKKESYTKLLANNSNTNSTNSNTKDTTQNPKTTEASSFLASISNTNINTLGISSPTKYLIYVNLNQQKTYIFTGKMNNWTLSKTMPCSTGIVGDETPKGVFDITDRGDWFFSEKYNDGAKYWVQFKGNYLFHSLPFKDDKKTITDYTLGKAASHGCIRLSLEDSKWLYDNISNKTKVIVN